MTSPQVGATPVTGIPLPGDECLWEYKHNSGTPSPQVGATPVTGIPLPGDEWFLEKLDETEVALDFDLDDLDQDILNDGLGEVDDQNLSSCEDSSSETISPLVVFGDRHTDPVCGFDRLFHVDGDDIVVEYLYQRVDHVDFELKFGNKQVFLHNKNLHSLPRQLRGVMTFIGSATNPDRGMIGCFIQVKGSKGLFQPLIPKQGNPYILNLATSHGFYVQQIWGPSAGDGKVYHRGGSGLEMSLEGPDICLKPPGTEWLTHPEWSCLNDGKGTLTSKTPRPGYNERLQAKETEKQLGAAVIYISQSILDSKVNTKMDGLYWIAVGCAWGYCERKYFRDFVGITKESLKTLYKTSPFKDLETYEEMVRQLSVKTRTMLIPLPVNGDLIIKLVSDDEFENLLKQNSDHLVKCNDGFQYMISERNSEFVLIHENTKYLFAFESEPDSNETGVQVSRWRKDWNVVRTRVTTDFVLGHLRVFKKGFGDRPRAKCWGSSNVYINARGSKRPKPSPMQSKEKVGKYQYYREMERNHLLQPLIEKVLHELGASVKRLHLDRKMEDTADASCGAIIGTTGDRLLAFGNTDHLDKRDRYRKYQLRMFLLRAKRKSAKRTILLKGSGSSTTCGYQVVFQGCNDHKDVADVIGVEQFFFMGGLGLAVEILDGICHRFLGSVFIHSTSICLGFRRDGQVTIARHNDSCFIYAWGEGKNSG